MCAFLRRGSCESVDRLKHFNHERHENHEISQVAGLWLLSNKAPLLLSITELGYCGLTGLSARSKMQKKSAAEAAAPNNNHQRRMEEYVLNKGGEIQNMSTF